MANIPPLRRTPAAILRAATARRPSRRSTGIMPNAGNSRRVFQLSRYSTLPTKLSVRRAVMISTTESKNATWLAARIAGPRRGSGSPPSTRTRHSRRYNGVAISLASPYPGPNRAIDAGPPGRSALRRVELCRDLRNRPTPNADGHQSDRPITESVPAPTVDDGVGLLAWFDGGIVRSAVGWRVDPWTTALMASLLMLCSGDSVEVSRGDRPHGRGPHQASVPSRETPPRYRRPIASCPDIRRGHHARPTRPRAGA